MTTATITVTEQDAVRLWASASALEHSPEVLHAHHLVPGLMEIAKRAEKAIAAAKRAQAVEVAL